MKSPVHALVALLSFALSIAIAAPAMASPKDDAAVEEASKARYAEGVKLFSKKKYDQARAAFLQASALKDRPAVTLMLAVTSLKLGRAMEALMYFDVYATAVPEPTPRAREILEAGRREARSALGRVRVSAPDGVDVTIDGQTAHKSADGAIDVEPGAHTVAIARGDDKKSQTVDVAAGATVEVKLALAPKPLVAPQASRPAPSRASSAASSSSEPRAPEAPGLLSPPRTTWPFYAAGAVGLAGLGASVVFGGLSANAHHAIDVTDRALLAGGASAAKCAQPTAGTAIDGMCAARRNNVSAASDDDAALRVSLVVGAVGTAVAVGWYLLAPKEGAAEKAEPAGAKRNPQVAPWASASGGGAVLTGQF